MHAECFSNFGVGTFDLNFEPSGSCASFDSACIAFMYFVQCVSSVRSYDLAGFSFISFMSLVVYYRAIRPSRLIFII